MKVLQVNVVYKKGSTGKITYELHKGLMQEGIESVVCYGRGEKVNEVGVYKTCSELYSKVNNALSRITGVLYGGCFFSTNKLIRIIKKEKPDIVHLQCINGYFVNIYRLITWLKKQNIRTVLTLHAEFMYTANCGHALECERWKIGCGKCPRKKEETKSLFFDGTACSWKKMRNAFDGFEKLIVTSVSPWLMKRASESPILKDKKHRVIYNGVNTEIFHLRNCKDIRKQFKCFNKKIVFHATPFFSLEKGHLKGGWYICKLAKMMPDTMFLVAGSHNSEIKVPSNIHLLGRIDNQDELAEYYSAADVTLIASKKETFSMIVAESLCCGTPVVGFKAGGPEEIAISEFSDFIEYGDINELKRVLEKRLYNYSTVKKIDISYKASKVYSVSQANNAYINCYYELM